MFWQLTLEPLSHSQNRPTSIDGRFVLHRHRDATGPHLDLRLEQDGYLTGWRIDDTTLDNAPWATEKMPHPLRWLDQDGDAERVDCGEYAWLQRAESVQRVLLRGREGDRFLRVDRAPALPPDAMRSIAETLRACKAPAADAAQLIRDGVTARQRAIARLCGLGRELDGNHFDEDIWRKTMAGLALEEIHQQLRGFERRFDAAYPPVTVSQPELLEGKSMARRGDALVIARDA